MKTDCVFCRIAAGELPAAKVYEDSDTLAFMDIGPVIKGHTLVIPKRHYNPITGTPVNVLAQLIAVVQKIAKAHVEGLGADGLNITQANGTVAGQIVPHIHFHVIPRFQDDKHSWNWTPRKYDNENEMHEFAGRIRNALEQQSTV